ncbi:MAG: methyltransferase domain-containing protein [Acidimicrobiales bacterium]|nr:methyltransferase domain-containing protein [Acidimicrobiales bacterium]
MRSLLGPDLCDLRIELYDGTALGPAHAPTTVRITSPDFFRRVLLGLGSELAFSRAYVAGEVEVVGDIYGIMRLRDRIAAITVDSTMLGDAAELLGVHSPADLRKLRPLPPPPEEIRLRGRLHSPNRDSRAVSAHYDVSNAFYKQFLDRSMTYSCAVFEDESDTLEQAQLQKYELIGRKLGLRPGMRLLDVGCGWGGMLIHAAHTFGVHAVGITVSQEQQELAEKRVAEAGLTEQIQVRLQDYRKILDGPFDAVSSIGMFEHVGQKQLARYFNTIAGLLVPGGRLLNHAINRSTPQSRARITPNSFMARYVFPDGELLEPGRVVSAATASGLEVRHLESLREHYALTLRRWVQNLEENWDEAVRLTSLPRAKIWRLYMAGSALAFEANEVTVTQILATKTVGGDARFPRRPEW